MDIYKLKWTRLQNEIFRLLCIKTGEPLNQRAIANLLKVSPTAVAKAIVEMEKDNIIKMNKQGSINLNLVELNRDNPRAIELKRVENMKILYQSGVSEFLEEKFPGALIILFGSYSYGEDTLKSDIDIAVIGVKEKEINMKKFEKLLEREIRINFYNNFKNIHKHLKENLCNGILLKGGIEL